MSRSVSRILAATGLLGGVALFVGAQAPAVPQGPTKDDEKTARAVVYLLEKSHMARPTIDDETAKKWCRTFLKDLDPQKYIFLKSDIDEFLPQATTLDDKIREGNLSFAFDVFKRYIERSDERLAMANEILKEKPDFTIDESMPDDPELIDYPADKADARDRLRKRIKLELLQFKIDDEPEAEAVKKLGIRYHDRNRLVHQFNDSDKLEIYLSSLSRTFDPHTSYMNKESLEDLVQQSLQLTLTGIGASLQSEDGYAVVKELIPGGPADKDGRLQPEDKIVGIRRPDGSDIDFVERRLKDVVRDIRGDAGTLVNLIVLPSGSKEKKFYELTRAKVELSEAKVKDKIIDTTGPDGKTLKLGVINLPAFYGDSNAVRNGAADAVSCTKDTEKKLNEFKAKGVNAVIMDLRGNGGGLLDEAISLSGLFIDKGPVVQVRETTGVDHNDDEVEGTVWSGPLVVLIDRQSASASEIFAGVIKDYGRGLIIGDVSTFGKGTVQQIIPINDMLRPKWMPGMGALKLTIRQFYRVNGESTQIKGVPPDIHIPSIFDQPEFGEGKMENALKFDKVAELPHDQYNKVPSDLVTQLTDLSQKRRDENEKFRKRDDAIKRIIERKSRHAISLNEAKFRAETVSDDEEKNEAKANKNKPKKRLSDRDIWESNFYNDEIVRIVGDYLKLGSRALASEPIRAAAN